MDFSNKKFNELILQSSKIIERWYSEKIRGSKIYENKSPDEIKEAFSLPEKN